MRWFYSIAPFLTNPLVLVGFALLLFYGFLRSLLKAKIIPPLPKTTGGKLAISLLRYAFIIALVAIVFGFAIGGYRLYQSRIDQDQVAGAIGRALQPLDSVAVSYAMDVPMDGDVTLSYINRLQKEIEAVVADYRAKRVSFSSSAAALGTDATRKARISLRSGIPTTDNLLKPTAFSIHPGSPLLPAGDAEFVARQLLALSQLHLTVYKKPIDVLLYKTIFEATNPPADLVFPASADPFDIAGPHADIAYSVGSNAVTLEVNSLPIRSFWKKTSNLSTVQDLRGAQVFLYPNPLNQAFETPEQEDAWKRAKQRIKLLSASLDVGYGKKVNFEMEKCLSRRSDWGDPIYVCTIPDDL
jgi:hypothetical protein